MVRQINWIVTTVIVSLFAARDSCASDVNSSTYRAAVMEFKPINHTGNDKETIKLNIQQAVEYAQEAGRLGVDILAFPEYGITTFDVGERADEWTRQNLLNGVEDLNPEANNWNPCLEPERFQNASNYALREMSCAALNNSVAILLNLLTREVCSSSSDPNCPKEGYYLYNTNVVFAKNGTLVARYHKYHLAGEDMLNKPQKPEYVIFDLGFATFGTFICFDIFFNTPGVDLVTKYGIRNLIFSTAWANELPFHTSPQEFAQFAHGVGANLLVPNMYYPELTRLGSGIYSSSAGALNETWDLSSAGRMVIADVPTNPPFEAVDTTTCADAPLAKELDDASKPESCLDPIRPFEMENQTDFIMTDVPSSNYQTKKTHRIDYEPLVDYDYANLTDLEGKIELCQRNFCCNMKYEFNKRDPKDVYVLVVRNGCRVFGINIGIQVCAILRCEEPGNIESCGRIPKWQPASRFKKFEISAVFQTNTIFPNVYSTNLSNIPREMYKFSKYSCQEEAATRAKARATLYTKPDSFDYPVMVASLYGRMYNWD